MTKDRMRALSKLTCRVDGELRFQSNPPVLMPVEELVADRQEQEITEFVLGVMRLYRRTLPEDRRRHGVILEMPVTSNTSLAALDRISTRGWINFRRERTLAADYVRQLEARLPLPAAAEAE